MINQVFNCKHCVQRRMVSCNLTMDPGVQIRWSNLPPICVAASQTQYTIQQQNSDAQKNSMLSRQQLREMEHWYITLFHSKQDTPLNMIHRGEANYSIKSVLQGSHYHYFSQSMCRWLTRGLQLLQIHSTCTFLVSNLHPPNPHLILCI